MACPIQRFMNCYIMSLRNITKSLLSIGRQLPSVIIKTVTRTNWVKSKVAVKVGEPMKANIVEIKPIVPATRTSFKSRILDNYYKLIRSTKETARKPLDVVANIKSKIPNGNKLKATVRDVKRVTHPIKVTGKKSARRGTGWLLKLVKRLREIISNVKSKLADRLSVFHHNYVLDTLGRNSSWIYYAFSIIGFCVFLLLTEGLLAVFEYLLLANTLDTKQPLTRIAIKTYSYVKEVLVSFWQTIKFAYAKFVKSHAFSKFVAYLSKLPRFAFGPFKWITRGYQALRRKL